MLLHGTLGQAMVHVTRRLLHARRIDEADDVALGVQKHQILEREIQKATAVRMHGTQGLDLGKEK